MSPVRVGVVAMFGVLAVLTVLAAWVARAVPDTPTRLHEHVFSGGFWPAVVVGVGLGLLARFTRTRSPVFRRTALLVAGGVGVLVLAHVRDMLLAPIVSALLVPVLLACLVVERLTRREAVPDAIFEVEASPRMPGRFAGLVLALANLVFIAVALDVSVTELHGPAIVPVFGFGLIPSLIAGGYIGDLAERSRTRPVWCRRLLLVVPAFIVVFLLGMLFELVDYVPHACIPTLVGTWILEHVTRARPGVLPVAITHVQGDRAVRVRRCAAGVHARSAAT